MGRLVKFETGKLPDLLVVGKELRHSMEALMKGENHIPAFWDACFEDGIFDPLEKQGSLVYDKSYVGFMTDWEGGDGYFSYIIGMLMNPGTEIPEGYAFRGIAAARTAVGWIQGADVADVCSNAHELTETALKKGGYGCNGMKWSMELYNCPRFTTPDKNGEIILDYLIPLD